jgi:hypothetical protein
MIGLQNNLLKSSRRKLNQPRPLFIIARNLFGRQMYAYIEFNLWLHMYLRLLLWGSKVLLSR